MMNQNEWLRARKNLLHQVKFQVEMRVGRPSVALRQYAKSLDREFRGSWRPSNETELSRVLSEAQVVLSADFHAYAQSQRAHLRILRDLMPDRDIILALECLPAAKNKIIQDYVDGYLSEARFLEKVGWHRAWGFPWENYRPLIELARDRGFRVVGLNAGSQLSLPRQDAKMAQFITELHATNAQALIYVVVGEWHLAGRHLPGKVRSALGRTLRMAVLFQDIEQLYFRLAKSPSRATVDYLRGSGDRFCIMVSPPWMKWQSYLMFLEHAYDRELQEDLAIDYSDHVASLVEVLSGDIKVPVQTSRLQVFCPSSKSSLSRLKVSLPKRYSKVLQYHLEHDLSFLLPEKDWLYLSRPTINHASSLAGQFIHAHLAKRGRALWDFPVDFLPLIWVEAIGFFFSKWINPKRKAEHWDSLRMRLAASRPKDKGRAALLLALDHRLSEVMWIQTRRMRRTYYRPRDQAAYVEAAHLTGDLLGERLFQMVRSNTIKLPQLQKYLRIDVDSRDFSDFYWNLICEIEHDQRL